MIFHTGHLLLCNSCYNIINQNGIAHRKHIIADHIRYIGKESNNLDEESVFGVEGEDYLEYAKDHEIVKSKEFLDWILSLKPKDVRVNGISQQTLYKVKTNIKSGKQLNPKVKIIKILIQLYKDPILNNKS